MRQPEPPFDPTPDPSFDRPFDPPIDQPVDRAIDRPVDRKVDRQVDRQVDRRGDLPEITVIDQPALRVPHEPRSRPATTVIVPVRSTVDAEDTTERGLPAYLAAAMSPALHPFRAVRTAAVLALVAGAGVAIGRYSAGSSVSLDVARASGAAPAHPVAAVAMVAERSATTPPTGDAPPRLTLSVSPPASPTAADAVAPTAPPTPASVMAPSPRGAVAAAPSHARRRRARAEPVDSIDPSSENAPPPARTPDGVTVRSVADAMIAAYAAAIEARDVERLARAYPALTQSERARWARFFGDVRLVDPRLTVQDFRVLDGGDVAEARVTGLYVYETAAGQPGRESVSFRALFGREPSGAWRLVQIR